MMELAPINKKASLCLTCPFLSSLLKTPIPTRMGAHIRDETRIRCNTSFVLDVAIIGMLNSGLYAASKGAVIGWTRTIAHEWESKYYIRTNIISPTIKTQMYEKKLTMAPKEMVKAHLKENKRSNPIGGV